MKDQIDPRRARHQRAGLSDRVCHLQLDPTTLGFDPPDAHAS
jgi:hypothetical protein